MPFALGVVVRVSTPNFLAADLTFEAVILMGVVGGEFAGVLAAVICAVPAALHGEYLALPFNLAVALIASLYGSFVEEEEVWSFSPFVFPLMKKGFRWAALPRRSSRSSSLSR